MKQILVEKPSFQKELINELENFQTKQYSKYPLDDTLRIDLHCHDYNSDVPDELLGRILNLPETWLKSETLIKTLKQNHCTAYTITNHNNARSCFEMQDKGFDILTAAEFSCTVPDFKIGIHVLTYGFNSQQEKMLNKLRNNVYAFQDYALENDIPTIWAHPLYHYNSSGIPNLDFFNKMALVFERFEVLNGQRDTWQNMLVKVWLESLTPERIDQLSVETGIAANRYCKDPYKKSMSGGSDSHMGFFSGLTGTLLYVPQLNEKLRDFKPSELALQAIKDGNMAPYGSHHNSEKLTVAFLDYVFQIALNRNDPGLLRILLHKGTSQDKLIALLVSNGFAELRRHKVTMNFIELFHNCFQGKAPSITKKILVPKVYKPIFKEALSIAETTKNDPENIVEIYKKSVFSISDKLNTILFKRLIKKIDKFQLQGNFKDFDLNNLMDKFELPSEFRAYIDKESKYFKKDKSNRMSNPNLSDFMDGLSFPFLASALILAANYTSSKVLYNVRPLLHTFSEKIGKLEHPKRMLWLTDTFDDNNGVSMVLQSMLHEIKQRDLPIDILVCSDKLISEEHFIVIKPLAEFTLPMYKEQPIRVPNYLEIHKLFHENEYDRIICSTEGLMGLAAIYLKNAYSVKASFYIHTDWITFAKKVLNIDRNNLNRFTRLLRMYYNAFDNLFVLNTDQQKWLTSPKMGFDASSVFMTAHWVEDIFIPKKAAKKKLFNIEHQEPVLLFAGRLSKEKGVMELPEIYQKIKTEIHDLKIVIAGNGPAENELRKALPEAIFLGWMEHDKLPNIYSSADLLILPSKFDTFSCVVLESLSCGLPVIAYNIKGPKDIIEDNKNGFLVSNTEEMAKNIIYYFNDISIQKSFKKAAIERSKNYNKSTILDQFLKDVELQ
ncbi:MAG: glycosyltransferase [Bacteroidetes bacterium]|nr:glycosyltransferase [Bacteroidota bacterium]